MRGMDSDVRRVVLGAVVVVQLLLAVLVFVAWTNPHAEVPFFSKTLCTTVKGGVWFDSPDMWRGVDRPGCYRVD